MRVFILAFALALLRMTRTRRWIEGTVEAMLDGQDKFLLKTYGNTFPNQAEILAENERVRRVIAKVQAENERLRRALENEGLP